MKISVEFDNEKDKVLINGLPATEDGMRRILNVIQPMRRLQARREG